MWHEFLLKPTCEGDFDMKTLLSIFEQSNASLFEIGEVLFLSVSIKKSEKLGAKLLSMLEKLCIAGHTLIICLC